MEKVATRAFYFRPRCHHCLALPHAAPCRTPSRTGTPSMRAKSVLLDRSERATLVMDSEKSAWCGPAV